MKIPVLFGCERAKGVYEHRVALDRIFFLHPDEAAVHAFQHVAAGRIEY